MVNYQQKWDALNACYSLASWFETWKNKEGAYLGFVVHRGDLKRLFKIHDDAWAQSSIINGYINIFKKTGDKRWIQRSKIAGDLLVKRLNPLTGKYKYAGWENDKSTTLAHCALADCALLNLSRVMKEIGRINEARKYVKAVKANIEKYLIKVLWNPKIHAFHFGDFDPYFPFEKRYIANMNSVTVEALVKLSALTGEKKYLKEYAIPVGRWLLAQQVKTEGIENGGISYSHIQPKVLIAIYTALAIRGLDDLYLETGDRAYVNMMENASKHLLNIRDPKTGLFYHGIFNGEIRKYPQFVAGAGIILKALNDTIKVSNKKFDLSPTIESILKRQLPIGGFNNFVGYDTFGNGRKKGKQRYVWEDLVPIVGWNGFLFEFLSELLPDKILFGNGEIRETFVFNPNFVYYEDSRKSVIIGKCPVESTGFHLYFKKKEYGFVIAPFQIFSLLLKIVRARARSVIRSLQKKSEVKN